MRLVLVGPPGSGKGTQAERLTERLNLRYVGTGNILREAIRQKLPSGLLAEPYLKLGQLVPDDLVNALVADLFERGQIASDVVFDGYPRTVAQAIWFDEFLAARGAKLDAVIQLVVDDEAVVKRIAGRRVCPNVSCGASYNVHARPPKVVGVCDNCGTWLVQRDDDSEPTTRNRLKVFHESTYALVEYYANVGLLRRVPTQGSPDATYADILRLLPQG